MCREAEFLHEVATIEESFTGIGYWWIGLTDMGMFYFFSN